MKIAAFVNASGAVVDFYEEGEIRLFNEASNQWDEVQTVPLSLKREEGLALVRSKLMNAVAQLNDCEIFLVRELRGILRIYLEEMGYRVWKSEGSLAEQLKSVALHERELQAQLPVDIPSPELVGDAANACYRINLIDLLLQGKSHTSRDVLMPFFEVVSFHRLEVVCDHLPKWFAMELASLGLRIDSETEDANGITAIIAPQCGARSCPPGKSGKRFSCHCG